MIREEQAQEPQKARKIAIGQINLNKCKTAQLEYVAGVKNKYDVMCIQEPYYDCRGTTRATNKWHLLEPTRDSNNPKRAITMITTDLKSMDWKQIKIDSSDIVVVEIKGQGRTVEIYNIYNDGNHSEALKHLKKTLDERMWRLRKKRREEERRGKKRYRSKEEQAQEQE